MGAQQFKQSLYWQRIISFKTDHSDSESDQICLFHIPAKKPIYN